jgi:hypothetical protein
MAPLFPPPPDDGAHHDFVACRDHPRKAATRAFLESAYAKYGHLIGDHPAKFLTQFRTSFHDGAWHLYLLAALSEVGWQIDPGEDEGPDIAAMVAASAFGSKPS